MMSFRKKVMATAFTVASLTFAGTCVQASDFDNPAEIMQTINSASKHKAGYKYVKIAPKRLYFNRNSIKKYSSGGEITGFASSVYEKIDKASEGLSFGNIRFEKASEPSETSYNTDTDGKLQNATGTISNQTQNYKWTYTNPNSNNPPNTDGEDIAGGYYYGNNSDFSGGAVLIEGASKSVNADFIKNSAQNGGAVSNVGSGTKFTGDFIGNSASASGGAIYNAANATVTGNFIANNTTGNGGAIYNEGALTIETGGNDLLFIGNTAGDAANDIYNKGTVNLNAGAGKTIYLTGGVDGEYGTVNLTGTGTVDTSTIQKQTVKVQSGELHLSAGSADGSNLEGSTVSVASGALINTIDGVINDYGNKIALAEGANLKTDIALATGDHDTFTAEGAFNLTGFGVTSDSALGAETEFTLSDKAITVADNIKAITSLQEYSVTASETAGNIKVTGLGAATGGINNAVSGTTSEGDKTTVAYTLTADSEDFTGGTIKNSDFSITGNGKDGRVLNLTDNNMVVNSDATLALTDVKLAGSKIIENSENATLTIKDSAIGVTIHNKGILNSDPTDYTARQINDDTATYSGDTFKNIDSTGSNGGAIYNTGTLTVQKEVDGSDTFYPTFENNSAQDGGAIYSTGTATISDAKFSGNSATGDGGALVVNAANAGNTTSITNSTFENNTANSYEKADSGAISVQRGVVNINGSTFTGNKAKVAGALYAYNGVSDNYVKVVITDSVFRNNEASGEHDTTSGGGAIVNMANHTFNSGDAGMTILGTTFDSNKNTAGASTGGGAIFLGSNSATNIGSSANKVSAFTNNTSASAGGAIGMRNFTVGNNSNALLDISNATFSGNTAVTTGGAIDNYFYNSTTNSGYVTVANSTFTSNSAANGGAIYNHIGQSGDVTVGGNSQVGKIYIANSSFTSNSATANGGAIYNAGEIVINGGTFTKNSATANGGAIYNAGKMTVQKEVDGSTTYKPTFENNSAKNGGAIYNSSTVASSISDAVFTNNYSTTDGGAIYVAKDSAKLTINDSTFTGNGYKGTVATTANGGAISAAAGTNIEINDSTFTGNIAKYSGGAIYVKATKSNKATLNINGSTISNNTANSTYGGGGIHVEQTNITLDDTDVTSNTALKAGGGINNRSSSVLVVKGDSHIDNNKANTSGGGIHNQGADTNSVTITASSVSGNTSNSSASGTTFVADNGGGGIYSSHGTLLVQNGSKINDNTAKNSTGGGIRSHATATINASEVKGNRAVQGAGIYNQGTLTVTNGSTISENIATALGDEKGLGGGIFNTLSGSVTIENSTFSGNQATNVGGAIISIGKEYTDGTVERTGTTTITGGTFIANKSTEGSAGAIGARSAGDITIDGVTFGDGTLANANTAATLGGVIHSNNTTVNIKGTNSATIFNYNTAANGGAISAIVGSSINIENAIFNLNKATADDAWGGAIYADNSSLTIDKDANDNKVYFTNNSADWGGAVAVSGADTELSVKNAEFELNSADVAGGAISIANNIKSAIIDNVKFGDTSKGNTAADAGGAVWFGIDGAITNSTFTANSTTDNSDGGGALFVGGGSDLVVIGSKFDSNVSASRGGAIATRPVGSSGSSSLYITGDGTSATEFNGNTAATNGGAIWTEVKTVIANTNFKNNIATNGNGGAISHTATDANRALGIIADGQDVTFSGNKANNVNNDIYNAGQLELIATGTNKITLGGGITGSNGTVNINDLSTINSYKVLNGTTIEDKTITAAAGEVVFGGNVSDQTINVKAGKLTNNATLTALGGSNSGTIDGTGDFVLNKSGSTFTNSGSFTQKSLTITNGNFITDADNLHLTDNIVNEGTLTINAAGTIAQSIVKDTAGNGIVEIAAGSGNVVDITAGKTITDNVIKLTSGTFDAKNLANTDGDIDLSGATKIVANGGTLNVQDGKTGNISLGVVDTATNTKALNVNIDVDLGDSSNVAKADVLNVATGSDLTNKINLSSIKWVDSTIGHTTEDDILIADDTLGDAITLAMAEIDTTDTSGEPTGVGNLLVSKSYVSDEGTYLHTAHTDLKNAIISEVDDKAYVMGEDSKIDGLKLGGSSLSVTTKGHDITSTSNDKSTDGITFDSTTGANQSINIIGTAVSPDTTNTVISGFKTAIDNSIGGKVSLKDVTMTGNTVDVVNTGEGEKGLFIAGTSTLDKVYDSATGATGAKGQTTIGNGDATTDTVTIGEIIQENVNVKSDGVLNIAADKLQTTAGTDNAGQLNLSGTTTAGAETSLNSVITGTGTTDVTGNVSTNAKSVQQGTVNAKTGSNLNLNGSTVKADKINVDNATLTLSNGSTLASQDGTSTTAIDLKRTDSTLPISSIAINAKTADTALRNAVISSTDGSGYTVTAHSEGSNNAIIDNAIANAMSITADNGTKLTLTENAMNSTSAPVSMGDNSKLTLANNGTDTAGATMSSDVSAASGTSGYTVDVTNANAGDSVDLKSVIADATSVNVKSGELDIKLDDDGNIGTTDVTLDDNSAVGFTTASDYVVSNNVTGTGEFDPSGTVPTGSKVNLNGNGSNKFSIASDIEGATVVINNAELILPNEDHLTTDPTNPSNVEVASDGTLNTMNGQNSSFNDTVFQDGASLKVDADVFKNSTDNFVNPNELGNEYLTDISVQGLDKIYNTKSVNLTNKTGLDNLQAGAGLADLISSRYPYVVTPVRLLKGQVQQTDEGLMLQFVPTAEGYEGFNSAVLAAPIAAQMGGYLTQLHSYDEAFRNMDMYMLMTKEERQAMKMRNKFAAASKDLIYDPTTTQYENKAGWFRPYATFENVGLDNGPRVSNVAYGTFAGGESEMYDLGHGWDGMWGAYVGYNGSHQAYGNHNSIYQNGGTLGVVGMAYKGDFFTGLTINAGANGAEASTMYGTENFAMLMAGIASKTGYNWELANGKFIIQPSALVSYSFVNTFDYRNAAGIDISNDPLHAIQIEPGIKFIGNLKNGWQPYASVSMVWNIMDKTHFHANEVALPEMSVKPFVKYGVGVRKSWGERFTAFFQTYFTNGGRNGVGLQAGFRWTLGKAPVKTSNSQANTAKKAIK